MVCAVLTVLEAITGFTVISIADETSAVQGPDETVLLYQVVAVNAPGKYPLVLFVPDAEVKPVVLLVVDDCQR